MAERRLTRTEISSNWAVKQTDAEDGPDTWRPVQKVPTVVHLDLDIPDPFKDLNELDVRWVGEKSWTYRTEFIARDMSDSRITDLVFQGLDTFATVRLNGKEILKADNMFIEYRVNVNGLIQDVNEMEITFEPARKRGLGLVKEHPEHRFIVHQTEVSRAPVRKAQYQWGWDWGPILLTCGPWRPVLLETYDSRIENVDIHIELSRNLTRAILTVTVQVVGQAADLEIALKQGEKTVATEVRTIATARESNTYEVNFYYDNPEVWWPHGYGKQPLYELHFWILAPNRVLLDKQVKRIGFRRAELVQDKDNFGQSFFFKINNVDMFIGGSCWVPADSFPSRTNPEEYRKWVQLMVEGNQIMTRVWGGGIYEADAFYEACDELGVLVWQDFAFACASYPTYPEFMRSVEIEARQNVRRLRDHPSLVVWAGNNEDYQLVERYNLDYNFDDKDPASWLKSDFPARYYYEYLFPKIIKEESSRTPYHPSSPWGNGKSTTLKVDPTVGDIHQWNVWHGDMAPYQKLPEMGGRFVSEFGMEALPHLSTLQSCVSDPAQLRPGSMVLDFHNKAIGHEQRLLKYVGENFRIQYDLGSWIHLTQIMQADAMSSAYKGWRRQWGIARARQCGGVLVWQLNDCWPTISWAVVDYYRVKKPAFYAIKRALEPVVVGVRRKFHDWTLRPKDELWHRDTGHIDPRQGEVEFDCWVASSRLDRLEGLVEIRFVSIEGGEDLKEAVRFTVDIEGNGTTEVIKQQKIDLPGVPFLIHASLVIGGEVVGSDVSWPDPIKYLDFADRGVEARVLEDGISISVAKPVKGFVIQERTSVTLSDNGFDLIPGETKTVRVGGVGDAGIDSLLWTFIGDDRGEQEVTLGGKWVKV